MSDSPSSIKAKRQYYCDRDSVQAMMTHCFLITPDANNELPVPTRGVMMTVTGTITGVFENDVDDTSSPTTAVTLPLLAGVFYPFAFKQVVSASQAVHGFY